MGRVPLCDLRPETSEDLVIQVAVETIKDLLADKLYELLHSIGVVELPTDYNMFMLIDLIAGDRSDIYFWNRMLTDLETHVPNVWHFPYFVGATSTNSLMIKLQPKIYDHIMLTVRISFIPSVCSQVPVIVIRLPEPRGLSVETSTNNHRFLMVFPLLTAALSTPPDIWCQIIARFLISSIIELAISVASIVQVREEGWTSGMRESGSIDKRGVAPLEPGKVTLNEFPSNSQPTYAIHSRKDEKTQKTPYRRSEMSDTSGALPLF
ncbi:hypothetical protein IFM89_011925 [Coptis chinensis]|uniref:Uncharacterized protein n=1 Tax=Coptis chinensis TaxID=261450 RepID=A0A835LXQ4_9MAGN|nr:hypothetical protein IFM89_011925 [Coptis chinensis]